MSTIRKGIETFLNNRKDASPYLIERWSPQLESQFLVHPGEEETEEGTSQWTNGREIWSNHRWPYKSGSNPYYKDKELLFSPGDHLKRVGSTWWNWETKRSVAVAFDIDVEGDGHAETTTTVTLSHLEDIVSLLQELPYVTLVRSTGGSGVHIYVFFDEEDQPVAENHNEHTQVALAVLEKMKADSGYDYSQHMDVKGVVFWFWADSSPAGHPGFSLISEATSLIGNADIEGYKGKALQNPNRAVKVVGYDDDGQPIEDDAESGGYKVYDLDDDHKSILQELENMGYTFIWQGEFNMAHTHTMALKELFERRKSEGRPLRGIFETMSRGSDKTKPNCYITPRPDGVFQVKRFGNGISEHGTWHVKDNDTWCYFNEEPPISDVLKKFSSVYDGNKYTFEASQLKDAMDALGHDIGDLSQITTPIIVTRKSDGTFYATMKDKGNFPGWKAGKSGQTRDLPMVEKKESRNKTLIEDVDKIARHVLTPELKPYGYCLYTDVGWVMGTNYEHIGAEITNLFGKEANYVKALIKKKPWVLTHQPFQKEYPEGRLWNKYAPQLAIEPSEKPGQHRHWDMVYDHLGRSLDRVARQAEWCQKWGITSGADYLRYWMAAMIQCPFEPLPYLFFYGAQNSGKSIFHESASMLMTPGSVVSASGALTNSQGFNKEVANAMIGYVEEKDLSAVKEGAYARMKEWVTGRTLTVTEKGETPYTQPNTLKLVQMANYPTACPMEDGDTRITALAVSIIPREKMIPKGLMEKYLKEEAPYFLRTLLTTHIPETPDRLRVPMLANEDKQDLESMNQKPWEAFAAEALFPCPGNLLKVADFYEAYKEYCATRSIPYEKSRSFVQLIRNRGDKYTVGMGPNKQQYIANVSMDEGSIPLDEPMVLNDSGRLVKSSNV